jgi:hypothetical protein
LTSGIFRLSLVMSAWGACALIGFWTLLDYELTPGEALLAADRWPVGTSVEIDKNNPTLVVFLHPHCPCSRASLAELQKLVTDCPEPFALQLVMVVPPEAAQTWQRSDLLTTAGRIPQARVWLDYKGAEAARFHASTSGETRCYSKDGRLLFQGGITASRGHEGGNVNVERLRAALMGQSSELQTAPVYGCPLRN